MTEFLTVAEAAGRLRVNERTIRRWIDAGELPAVRRGRVIRIPAAALEPILQVALAAVAPRATVTRRRPPTGEFAQLARGSTLADRSAGDTGGGR